MGEPFLSSQKKNDKDLHRIAETNCEFLFLNVLCTYFETEQLLDNKQIELFRKRWIAEEKKKK